jgi:AbrB family looped-hinge helix DNA binding protein
MLESKTFQSDGKEERMVVKKLVRLKQKGQLTIPAQMRSELGLKEGDLVEVTRTPDGLLITPQEAIALRALDQIGRMLKDQGTTLEELLESGRKVRAQLVEDMYGLKDSSDGD